MSNCAPQALSHEGLGLKHANVLRLAGYVEQFDTLLAELTVREMLMYTAELKRSVHVRAQSTSCIRRALGI